MYMSCMTWIATLLPAYSSIVGFIVGAILYYVLAEFWWFKKYKQKELEDPSDEKYLGITVGRSWNLEDEHADEVSAKTISW